LEELLASAQASSAASAPQVPPDELQGQMSLHWPPCVRYNRTDGKASGAANSADQQAHVSGCLTALADLPSTIYDTTLDAAEFRLAYLSASSREDCPVHVTLETHSDHNYPEYETVSYLWGGENGDSSARCPVFVGPYWDVLLQTQNCWSMLRLFRPHRGERTVWVDALCINQRNLQERAAQVAKMRKIYEQCTKVIVYLGEDLVTKSKPFPYRRTLDQLPHFSLNKLLFPKDHQYYETYFGMEKLLQRKYFARIWIIQELLYPEQVVFRVGDFDLRADAPTMERTLDNFRNSYSNKDMPVAPWL
jgi:hypothetical protein